MTTAQKLHRGRLIFGLLSMTFGISGFVIQSWIVNAFALGFALAWLVLCIASANRWIEDETERIAPRHRRNQ
jgi:hypothetical protein